MCATIATSMSKARPPRGTTVPSFRKMRLTGVQAKWPERERVFHGLLSDELPGDELASPRYLPGAGLRLSARRMLTGEP